MASRIRQLERCGKFLSCVLSGSQANSARQAPCSITVLRFFFFFLPLPLPFLFLSVCHRKASLLVLLPVCQNGSRLPLSDCSPSLWYPHFLPHSGCCFYSIFIDLRTSLSARIFLPPPPPTHWPLVDPRRIQCSNTVDLLYTMCLCSLKYLPIRSDWCTQLVLPPTNTHLYIQKCLWKIHILSNSRFSPQTSDFCTTVVFLPLLQCASLLADHSLLFTCCWRSKRRKMT